MPKYLHGLSLQFYRSIVSEKQYLSPFRSFNFFIGPNNAGKSTVLNFLNEQMAREATPSPLDRHQGRKQGELAAAIGVSAIDIEKAAADNFPKPTRPYWEPVTTKIIKKITVKGSIWIRYEKSSRRYAFADSPSLDDWQALCSQREWHAAWQSLHPGTSGGGLREHWIPQTVQRVFDLIKADIPEVRLIPAIRKIGTKDSGFDFSGQGLIERLAQVQAPGYDRLSDRDIFDRINKFLQTVTGRPEARIEVPHHRDFIQVHMDGKVLPLGSLGTGIEEVIMIAAFCTISENMIVCIEEPELHLHPLLQRKLMRYLAASTSNQYFIATHSASFIDTPNAAIFHVSNDGDQTRIRETLLRSERHDICVDLGYRASDIVQANAVIWVEGPSDRIYVRHWIETMNPELVEGIHYSIMFYGGRLLSHLSANADTIDRFIELRSLNQNLALIMDSDKSGPHSQINETKKRLSSELSKGTCMAWITKGREIENYVEHGKLQEAVGTIYASSYSKASSGGPYDHALFYERKGPKRRKNSANAKPLDLVERVIDKVEVARLVCSKPINLDVLDLRQKIRELVLLIQRANE